VQNKPIVAQSKKNYKLNSIKNKEQKRSKMELSWYFFERELQNRSKPYVLGV